MFPPRRTLPRTSLATLFLHYLVHLLSPRSSLRRPSRLHAQSRTLHGNHHHSFLHPPQTIRSIKKNSTTLPPLACLPRRAPRCTAFVVALSPCSASFRRKRCRYHRWPLQQSRCTPPTPILHTKIAITSSPRSHLPFCLPPCSTTVVRPVRLLNILTLCPSAVPLPRTRIIHRPLARPRVYHHLTRRRTCVPPSLKAWIYQASPQTALDLPVVLVRTARKPTTQRGSTPSNRNRAVRTWSIVHRSLLFSMPPTILTHSTCRHPRCLCQRFPLRRRAPSLSRSSIGSSTMCSLPRNKIRFRGPTRIRSALVQAQWRSHLMLGTRLFPERKSSGAPSELDTEYTYTMESSVYRRSAGSVVSLYGTASDTGTTTSTGSSAGPYFSDVTSEGHGVDEDGRRGSCVSTSEMLSRLRVGGRAAGEDSASPAGAGSDGYASEHGTVTYPSPSSDCERVNLSSMQVGQSPIAPHTSASSELALALHSNESSPYIPPPAFKFSEVDAHSPSQPQLPREYPSYNMAAYGGGDYSQPHPHANGYPPAGYPSSFDGIDGGGVYPHPVPPSSTADDFATATRYT
ncbi:hypothetical protein BJV74DRAFT_210939 [Russula compacta]|nr:hypothetical protein BJV74DRAFT_210939 [Russula compacta]